jgi:radical SAM superfamily enzyme YgiQ (UPF0313 family)
MRKIFTVEIAEKVIRDTYHSGITVVMYLLVGHPGETDADFDKTKTFLKRNKRFIGVIQSINPVYVMAGSELFRRREAYGITLPEEDGDIYWRIGEENTINVRKKRVFELKEHANKIGVPFFEDSENLEFTTGKKTKMTVPFLNKLLLWKKMRLS